MAMLAIEEPARMRVALSICIEAVNKVLMRFDSVLCSDFIEEAPFFPAESMADEFSISRRSLSLSMYALFTYPISMQIVLSFQLIASVEKAKSHHCS